MWQNLWRAGISRAALSIAGIALCALLMLFLLGAYRGVSEGSMAYIRHNAVDLWVLQRNATNILRCTSVLLPPQFAVVKSTRGVRDVSPVLLILATIGEGEQTATLYLAGYDPESGRGGPPRLVDGHEPENPREIVLDLSFARKYGHVPGDTVYLQRRPFVVAGLCAGTNAFVIQYAFVTLESAQRLIGIPGLATSYLVSLDADASADDVAGAIRTRLPAVEVFDHATFLANNDREMRAGFLPFVLTIAVLGVVVLTVILTLLLTIQILERRREMAVMKALGAPSRFLLATVLRQSLILAGAGMALALALFGPLTVLVARITPEVTVDGSAMQGVAVCALVLIIGAVSALLAAWRLRRIYAMEAFA